MTVINGTIGTAVTSRGVFATSVPSGISEGVYTNRPQYYEQWINYSNLDTDEYSISVGLPALDWSTYVTGLTGGAVTVEASVFDDLNESSPSDVSLTTERVEGAGGTASINFNLRSGPPSSWVGTLSNQLTNGDIRVRLRMWIKDITDDGATRTDTGLIQTTNGPHTGYKTYTFADGGLTSAELDAFGDDSSGYQWSVTVSTA